MTLPAVLALVAGVLTLGLSQLALYRLIPKLRARERRGDLSGPVPDPEESHFAYSRLYGLIWTLKTSDDGPRFRRHVMLVRWLPVIGIVLIVTGLFAMDGGAPSVSRDAGNRPPPVTIPISG